jgi:hypothetical protein
VGWVFGVMLVTVIFRPLFWGTEKLVAVAAFVAIISFIFVFPIFVIIALSTMGRVKGRSRPSD